MKRQISLLSISRLVVWMLLVSATVTGNAASVRGRVDQISVNHQRTAMPGVAIIISGGRVGRSAPVYTDRNGMFYLQNIPAGTYSLEIWINGRPQPVVYRIQVNEPYTDIPPVVM